MGKLTASMVVDLTDNTGRKVQTIIGNLDRLRRAERNADLASNGLRLSAREMAQERLMIEQGRAAEERRARLAAWVSAGMIGVTAMGYTASRAVREFADVDRQMTRIGITADATSEQTQAAFRRLQNETKNIAMPIEQGIAALDTLVASGLSLDEAMAFLPAVLATAQATGAATEDIANTGMKAASALKIEAKDLQNAFDIMVAGGKAGQFELKDMAQYIPTLANSFATLGYEGEDGLKRLIAVLQTIREDTGDASSAATQAQNIFGKIYSEETAGKFKKFGIDLRREMESATKSGEDAISAFVRLSKEAIKGDLSKLPLLFSDQEFRLGMQSLITSPESLKKFFDVMNSSSVDGTVFRDIGKIINDTQSSIDRMSSSWDRLMTSFGKAVAPPATEVMDAVSGDIDYGDAVREALKKRGMSYWQRETWMLKNMPFGPNSHDVETDQMAFEGGLRDPEFLKNRNQRLYESGRVKASQGRQNQRVVHGEWAGGDRHLNARDLPISDVPVPGSRPDLAGDKAREAAERRRQMERYTVSSKAAASSVYAGDPDSAARRDLWQRQFGLTPFEGGMHRAGAGAGPRSGEAGTFAAPADSRSLLEQLFGGRDFWLGAAADPNFKGRDHFGIETKAAETGPKSVTIDGAVMTQPSGVQQVQVMNGIRPNITINMPVTINEAANPQAIAQQLGQATQAEMNRVQASQQMSGAM